jgi:hypothetical protein
VGQRGKQSACIQVWPRGREINSRRAYFENLDFQPFLYLSSGDAFSALAFTHNNGHSLPTFLTRNIALLKMDACHRKSKMVQNMKLFSEKARTYGHFFNHCGT